MTEADDLALDAAVQADLDKLGPAVEPEADAPPLRAKTPRKRPTTRAGRAAAKAQREAAGGKPAAPKRATTTRKSTPTARINIKAQMSQLYTMAGVGLSMVPAQPNPKTGQVIPQAVGLALASNADACGQAWETLAKDNPRVRDALERLLTVSAVGSLITAHLPVIMAAVQASGGVGGVAGMLGGTAPEPAAAQAPAPPAATGYPVAGDPLSNGHVPGADETFFPRPEVPVP